MFLRLFILNSKKTKTVLSVKKISSFLEQNFPLTFLHNSLLVEACVDFYYII